MIRTILLALLASTAATAATVPYYIGLDNRPTLTSGDYVGLANPNFGRLTFLLNHGNHFHSIGSYSYTGPVDSPAVTETNENNRIPEGYSGEPPLALGPGSGPAYGGKLVNQNSSEEYGDLTWGSIEALQAYAPGTEEHILLTSSGGGWASSIAGASIGLELFSITPGLHVGIGSDPNYFSGVGDVQMLGPGTGFTFQPVFWTSGSAAPGAYSAGFRLTDLSSSGLDDSGVFYMDFAVSEVPEPGSLTLLGLGLAFAGWRLRRRS